MEELKISAVGKAELYSEIVPQIISLVEGESDVVANCANIAAALKEAFGFWWVGFYFVKDTPQGEKELVLGPFQGPIACTRIKFGKGVCGTAWKRRETIVVPDVDAFPGHIACSSLSKSEIVVPVFANNGEVFGVLDIDSEFLATFDDTDKFWLEKMLGQINFGSK